MAAAVPAFGRLRLAKLADLRRIGLVAAAGFYHSTFFPYARPFFADYPTDTAASYRAEYQEGILDPKKLVLVALDDYKENEIDSVYEALKQIYPESASKAGVDENGKVIVGIISMSLELDHKRHGQFLPEDASQPPDDPEDRKRDSFPDALKLVDRALKGPEEKWLKGHMEILSLGVHPAYWKIGHGHELAKWCLALADMDKVPTCVSASPMGARLCKSLGFVEKELVLIDGYEHYPEPIDISFQQRSVSEAGPMAGL
ncbi:hypothetical protein K458DRAFT_322048 [Lentithecium fluviatile CBS 122367]|uniref:N-acetyltransferase domain-containing protein n=1 Tax=Lentithecium fluviatile CBS 122367 TaxID=1168545 RepID=A0A6G1IE48_9PLEO|nr:hypothetical protein K458DRAFT_322048 [Lentithecium fluviatile CBS 122367]